MARLLGPARLAREDAAASVAVAVRLNGLAQEDLVQIDAVALSVVLDHLLEDTPRSQLRSISSRYL